MPSVRGKSCRSLRYDVIPHATRDSTFSLRPRDTSEQNCQPRAKASSVDLRSRQMSRYLSQALSGGLVDVLPRHYEIATPFRESTCARARPLYGPTGDATDALLTLNSKASDGAPRMRAGGRTPPSARTMSDEWNPCPDKLKQTNKRKHAVDSAARRREQCRANQARYRDKQRNAQLRLERSVEELHREIDSLKRRYRDLSSRERSNQSPWTIVAEVFRLLGSCFRSPWRISNMKEMKNHTKTRHILAVLEPAFDHDAALGDLIGVDALMEQLQRYSQYFGDTQLHLEHIESIAPGVMVAHARLNVTVTELTLRHIFPHLESSAASQYDEHKLLYQRLLGQRLNCPCSLEFLFDEDSNRVVRLVTNVDLASPLLRLLGNYGDVVDVLKRSKITLESVISGTE
ncbi:unnamed protein product [Phytophthora lilii]|uniref:Unnamed protein product n=1 Tax=Phytophthora lilii TaxID=2077276 RepID=A0A9W6U529_9STRA|nr:unnamed protein product [Phytophthora lilii]